MTAGRTCASTGRAPSARPSAWPSGPTNGTPHESSIYDRVVLYVGSDGTGRIKAFGGNDMRDGVSIDVGRGAPEVTVFDSTGTPVMDLVQSAGSRGR